MLKFCRALFITIDKTVQIEIEALKYKRDHIKILYIIIKFYKKKLKAEKRRTTNILSAYNRLLFKFFFAVSLILQEKENIDRLYMLFSK